MLVAAVVFCGWAVESLEAAVSSALGVDVKGPGQVPFTGVEGAIPLPSDSALRTGCAFAVVSFSGFGVV